MKVKYTKNQIIVEVISAIILIFTLGYIALRFGSMPQRIPTHFNALGQIDSYGSKTNILFLLGIHIAVYALITVCTFFPSIWNIPVTITEKNKEKAYKYSKSMIIFLKFEIQSMFLYIIYISANSYMLGNMFLLLVLISIFGTIAYYIWKIVRLEKK